MRKTENYIRRARLVKQIVDSHYEPGSHRGCLRYIWRVHVNPVYPMSESTFYHMLSYIQGVDGYVGIGINRVEKRKSVDVDSSSVQLELEF